ncbi:amidophosphoribosyltransferase [Denitromonas ohlonensis]|uniref:Amidophosphoribosyltransferase n=2 Tax=Denitromonas TaxID=139331 RepID=A0A557RVM0_9RHOO|nr:amidophosphoribosyltransferase [Denitromonas ohlonensis]TVT50311.1 MAG: amidophosphoribosyltransferase [Denitromonas halophila]TVO69189.1 amidophosphoribosyltransferase [Denitromonas ohlonensis]TVO77289.1 amidophosphoribosyltransferase [Denitromonas ohlonensis]TVT74982.1 MAG: amidophosphoribosyltransferase [Denitromonas halophila]TVT78088.1 MAG: amidophosphoribosyltransferase [Denitromonas halophila]
MCGILGVVATTAVNQLLYDGLQVLQHRGQDAAGIATTEGGRFLMHKGSGLVRDVFRTRNMRNLQGNWGIGHVRYPTAGSAYNPAEAQPFYVNSPFGLMLAHNGNLTNSEELKREMFLADLRHINTNSDSEVLLNVLAHELQAASNGCKLDEKAIFQAVAAVHRRCRGAYAAVVMIAGYGLLAFRDPYGIRPLVIGRNDAPAGTEWIVSSESVAVDALGFKLLRDVEPGEAIVIDMEGNFRSHACAESTVHAPCMFEYVYLARPDSLIDGVSVYEARLKMGEYLAAKFRRTMPHVEVDVVIPIPDSSRPAALEMANQMGVPYREGFVKNRYIGRTFIMPGQAVRRKSVRQKLNTIHQEFKGKRVLLVDDSIVRGTTSQEIVSMARDAGATKVYFASAAPPVRHANVYGIDMPTRAELIGSDRDEAEICAAIGADGLLYQDLEDLRASVRAINPSLQYFETSCFDGKYVTGDVTPDYLFGIENRRSSPPVTLEDTDSDPVANQLDLNLASDNSD